MRFSQPFFVVYLRWNVLHEIIWVKLWKLYSKQAENLIFKKIQLFLRRTFVVAMQKFFLVEIDQRNAQLIQMRPFFEIPIWITKKHSGNLHL